MAFMSGARKSPPQIATAANRAPIVQRFTGICIEHTPLLIDVVFLDEVTAARGDKKISKVVPDGINVDISGPNGDAERRFADDVSLAAITKRYRFHELRARSANSGKSRRRLRCNSLQIKVVLDLERVGRAGMPTAIRSGVGIEGITLRIDCYGHFSSSRLLRLRKRMK